jgi:hypothetical protein
MVHEATGRSCNSSLRHYPLECSAHPILPVILGEESM